MKWDIFLLIQLLFIMKLAMKRSFLSQSSQAPLFFSVSFGWITPVANNLLFLKLFPVVCFAFFVEYLYFSVLFAIISDRGTYIEADERKENSAAPWRRGFVQARSSIDLMSRVIGDVGRLPQARRLQSSCVLLSRGKGQNNDSYYQYLPCIPGTRKQRLLRGDCISHMQAIGCSW